VRVRGAKRRPVRVSRGALPVAATREASLTGVVREREGSPRRLGLPSPPLAAVLRAPPGGVGEPQGACLKGLCVSGVPPTTTPEVRPEAGAPMPLRVRAP